MNTREILNKWLYPNYPDNVLRKSYTLYDNVAITTGVLENFFFVTAPGNQFLRNRQLPLAGSEVFFVTGIAAYVVDNIDTAALTNSMNELLQQSFLEISVDNRVISKIPGLDFINYKYASTLTATATVLQLNLGGNLNADEFLGRKVANCPIIMNSSSAFSFRFVTTAAAATAFNGINMRLVLYGTLFDKLTSFYWDDLKTDLFQTVPKTYYETRAIANGNETTFNLFGNIGTANNLISQTFPLSDIQSMSIQNIEVFVNQPDTPIEPSTIYDSRIQNILTMIVDDRLMFQMTLNNLLSMFATFSTSLTTTPDTVVLQPFNVRKSYTLPVPLEIPATSKVAVTLQQPASSLGITGEFTVALRGVETRRVA